MSDLEHPVLAALARASLYDAAATVEVHPDAPVLAPSGGLVLASVLADTRGLARRGGRLERGHRVEVVRERVELFQPDPNAAIYRFRRGEMLAGTAASGKGFSRWATREWVRLRVMADGRWLTTAMASSGASAYFNRYVYSTAPGETSFPQAVRAFAHVAPAPRTYEDCFPLLDAGGARQLWQTAPLPAAMMNAFAGAGPEDTPALTRALFGARRYRKDLARAVAGTIHPGRLPDPRLLTGCLLAPYVPTDWLVEHLGGRGQSLDRIGNINVRGMRAHLRQLDQRSLRRLALTGTGTVHGSLLTDLSGWVPAPGMARADSWGDLHDRAMARRRALAERDRARRDERYRNAADAAFAVTDDTLHRQLEGVTPGGFRIELARDGATLDAWADSMHHCIDSYAYRNWAGQSLLGAIRQPGGTMLGNFEVTVASRSKGHRLDLTQMLGRFNAVLPAQVRAEVETHLTGRGVHVARYFGDDAQAQAA
ncbi:hypothetical protein CHO01_17270 [Cellulomonas hominis]|uniref:Uncharacterized protein n=1 Tax=Cellulomonas hominis TaxID=156981 RepID=A0A511FBH3_9CELL|nr:PcfJ domain-containing protein [Cellulomonas hominis]MBB5474572.1 hypothetical protein [Cellulomonas hominis]NKY05582.1 hypothetical protein [Cellulomonas hominis]GEL46611.1 hypothetical protein CHO01_17270 [Cellulomonas hominis]